MSHILDELKAVHAASQEERARLAQVTADASSLRAENTVLNQKCQSLVEDCVCLRKALSAGQDSAAEQFMNTVLLRKAVRDLAKAREELAAERQAAAAAHGKHQVVLAEMGSQRAALQRDLAVLAEQIKAKEASAADERSAASAAQAALRTQLDAAEARLLGAARRNAEQRLEAERQAFQASIAGLGGGGTQAAAAWKQRVAQLKSELQAACAERDMLKKQLKGL